MMKHCIILWNAVFLLLAQGTISTSNATGTTNPQCPPFREFDASNPTASQFEAPNGCVCIEGMQDLNCGYCVDDAPCHTTTSGQICRTDMIYLEQDTYKSYQCRLAGGLANLLPRGKVSVHANVEAGILDMSVYNRGTINDPHVMDCHITGCQFAIGGSQLSCDRTVCNCTDQCNSIVRNVVEVMLSGKPAGMTTEPMEDGNNETLVKILMEGAPMNIEAICNASSCTTTDDLENIDAAIVDDTHAHVQKEWKSSASLSVVILGCLGVGLVLLILVLVGPACCAQRRKSQQVTALPEDLDITSRISNTRTSVLEFLNITRTVNLKGEAARVHGQKEKVILQNISGSVKSGTLLGIMGPSGAGKSSLLNVLAAVDDGQGCNSGRILLNGEVQKSGYRNKVAYVHQDDCLFETLTVRECIEYSALLQLPTSMAVSQKQTAVWRTLDELQITHACNSRIPEISGGERKRVSIGQSLVTQPSVLFLDEPSSGLDAYAANQIMNVLSELAHRNRIVILSIHQPSMRSFCTMDQILLLGEGQVMYNGSPTEVGQYLESRGFPCPTVDTVADHMLEVVSHKANHDLLTDSLPNSSSRILGCTDDSYDDFDDMAKEKRSLVNELLVLLGRTGKDVFRNRELFVMQMCLSIVLACFVGGIFEGITNDLAGFQNRMGAFYFSLSFFAFASFSSMDIFVKERRIFVRETGSKYYRSLTYFLSKTVLDMYVLRIIPVTVFVCIFYWLMGLKSDMEAFVVFWATLVLFNMCAGIMSICISIATPTVGQANLIASVWFLVMLLFGGFLVNVQTMSPWYGWLRHLSIFYYSFEILMTNELMGLLLSFDAPGYPTIPIYGEVFLETIGMDADRQTAALICLCSLTIGFSVLAYLLLRLRVPASAGKHFQKMHNENKRIQQQQQKPPSSSLQEEEESSTTPVNLTKEDCVSQYDDEVAIPAAAETESMLETTAGSRSLTVTTSVLSAGSAASYWTCLSPSSSSTQEKEPGYA